MAFFSLGDVPRLGVRTITEWDYQSPTQRARILSDGTSDSNEILQDGSTPIQECKITGTLQDHALVETIKGYSHTKETVIFIDPTDPGDRSVIVFDFTASRDSNKWQWKYELVLIEAVA